MEIFNIICKVIIIGAMCYSVGVLGFGLIKKAIARHKAKKEMIEDKKNENK